MMTNGEDIRLLANDHTTYNDEIDTWNTSDLVTIWVTVPTILASALKTIFIYTVEIVVE